MKEESTSSSYGCGGFCRLLILVFILLGIFVAVCLHRDKPVTYESAIDQFKYGSTGGEREAGIPVAVWNLLPDLFAGHLPGKGYESLGFIYETNRALPIGVSQRNVQGIDRVFLNCAVCHAGTVRETPDSPRRVIVGMPPNGMNVQGFMQFLDACARDEQFNPRRFSDEINKRKSDGWMNRFLYRHSVIDSTRSRLLAISSRLSFMDQEPPAGQGRADSENAQKALFNFRMDRLPEAERAGNCDIPSIWNQGKRTNLSLCWDGSNNSVDECCRAAAFATGALPTTLDRASLQRMKEFILTNAPPLWPLETGLAKAGRGAKLYQQYCAKCHGLTGKDFTGELVGAVTPIEEINTDRHLLDSHSEDLCANQNLLYSAYPGERFTHFRKTFGYANQPLDGIWLRGPYLHNGSVPSLRDLLEPASKRPKEFYRGYDVIDRERVGFISNVPEEKGRKFFKFDTRLPGNGNQGHEGSEYGTSLSAEDKDAIVEYLKTF